MLMVDIRIMRMRVGHRLVSMRVGMRLRAIPGEIMRVPVMCIMHMPVRMQHGFMGMQMVMLLGQMQPDAGAHERTGQPESAARCFVKQ